MLYTCTGTSFSCQFRKVAKKIAYCKLPNPSRCEFAEKKKEAEP